VETVASYSLWTYIHVLLFVFWLGADVGVFVAAAYAKNDKLSFETRATLLKLAGFVDLFPRVSFALMLPVGLHLVAFTGIYAITPAIQLVAWLVAVAWIALVLTAYVREGSELAGTLGRVQNVFLTLAGLLFISLGLLSLLNAEPFAQGWFALKMLLFGCIFFAALAIDYCFRPMFAPFMAIGTDGSTPEREAAVTKAINRTLVSVTALYILIAAVAFLGTTKPF
jgi:hypothetical protein